MTINIESGVTVEQGIKVGAHAVATSLVLSLDAATYSGSGPWIDSVGSMNFTLYNSPTYSNSIGGGSFLFTPSSSQYAESSSGVGSLGHWSVEVWHYYTDNNSPGSPCIVTEQWPNPANELNFSLGSLNDNSPNLQSGFFNNGWNITPNNYALSAGNWYQIVGTYDGMTIKLYVNGSMVTSTFATAPTLSGNLGIKLMKRWDSNATQYWGGRLAMVNIWDGDINFEGVRASWLANKARFGL